MAPLTQIVFCVSRRFGISKSSARASLQRAAVAQAPMQLPKQISLARRPVDCLKQGFMG